MFSLIYNFLTKVSLALRRSVTGDVTFDAQVDDTITALEIIISGYVNSSTITSPSGTVYDLRDEDALESDANIQVTAFSPTFVDVNFIGAEVGAWTIDVR